MREHRVISTDMSVRVAVGLLSGLAAGGLAYGLALLYRVDVPLVVCLVAGLVATGAGLMLERLPFDDEVELVPRVRERALTRTSFGDLRTVEDRLSGGAHDQDRFDARLRPQLTALAVELLRQRHGLRWPAQRAEVRAVVGQDVWELLSAPVGSFRAERGRVETWIDAIEKI